MRRQSRGWSICASLTRTHVRRSIAFGSMSLSYSPLSTTKSVQFKDALMWCVRRDDRNQWRRFLCHSPGIPFQICAAHRRLLLCCRILHLCQRHPRPPTTCLLGNISLFVATRIFYTFEGARELFTCHVWCHLCFHVPRKMMCVAFGIFTTEPKRRC